MIRWISEYICYEKLHKLRSHQYLSLFPSNYNPNIVFLIIDHRQNTFTARPWPNHTTSWSCVSAQHCLWVRYVYVYIYTHMCTSLLSNINHHTPIIILFWEFPHRCLVVINKEIFECTGEITQTQSSQKFFNFLAPAGIGSFQGEIVLKVCRSYFDKIPSPLHLGAIHLLQNSFCMSR